MDKQGTGKVMFKKRYNTPRRAAAAIMILTGFAGSAIAAAASGDLAVPVHASYVTPAGAVVIAGDDSMSDLLQQLDQLFVRSHPQFKFDLDLKGAATALPALTADVSALAPITREAFGGERAAFKQVHGRDPVTIRIGYAGYGMGDSMHNPASVVVNRRNPLPGLTLMQLGQIFTSGTEQGDINLWPQIESASVPQECSKRRIHLYGGRDDGGATTSMRQAKLGKHPFAATYEAFETSDEIMNAVAEDVCGIGIVGAKDAAKLPVTVRVLALGTESGKFFAPTYDNVAKGKYPLSSFVQFYVNRADGTPLEPWIRAYLDTALSEEGQALIAAQGQGKAGFVPLSPKDLQQERDRLKSM